VEKLKDLFMRHVFSDALTLEERTANVVYLFGFVAALIASSFRFFEGGADADFWATAALLPIIIFSYDFVLRTRLYYIGNIIFLLLFTDIVVPIVFLSTGGTHSGFVLSTFAIFLLTKGKTFISLLCIHLAVIFTCYGFAFSHPDFVPAITGFDLLSEALQTFLITAFFIGVVIKLRHNVFDRDHERINEVNIELAHQEKLMHAVNDMALTLLHPDKRDVTGIFQESLRTMAGCVDVDRAYIWRNEIRDGNLYYVQVFEWFKGMDSAIPQHNRESFSYSESFPFWEDKLRAGQCISGPVRSLSQIEQERLTPYGIQSLLVIPVFLQDYFWGFVSFDDCQRERNFTVTEVNILQSGSLMLANALVSNNIREEIEQRDTLLHTLNAVADRLLKTSTDTFENDLQYCMRLMARGANVDRFRIWQNHTVDGVLHCTRIYEYSAEVEPRQDKDTVRDISYNEILPGWEAVLASGKCCQGLVSSFPQVLQNHLAPQGILSLLVVPVFFQDEFWGCMAFNDCHAERVFSGEEENLLRSGSLLITAAMRRELAERERDANEQKMREAEQRRNEQEIATHAAQAASEAKSQFLATMSHEIRTPMNAIIGMSELMRTDNLDVTQQRYFQDIRNMSHSLLTIINDILDFSKIEAGKLDLVPADYDIFDLYNNICALIKFTVMGHDLEFRHSIDSDIPRVLFGDEVRVRQIMTNILNNAVKYTSIGFVELRLKYIQKDAGAYLSITVKDTGIGIRKEDFAKLYDRFEQMDARKNQGITGTGLGLSIVKMLVDMMGGEILLESEYGRGSVFTVLLPLVQGNPDNIKSLDSMRHVMVSPEVKVLVVDDNAINLTVALGYLAQHGIQADTADSGFTALQMVLKKQYGIVFMDHMMPDMDGIETTQRIRALGKAHLAMPIVALTANAISGARKLFLDAGMNDFIPKPINARELNAVLVKWLPADKLSFMESVDLPGSLPAGSSSPALSVKGDSSVLDQKAGLAQFQNDEKLYLKILVKFRQEHQDAIEEVRNRLAAGENKVAHRLAHTLKSTAATIGAEKLRQAAFAVERALAEAGDGCMGNQLTALETELQRVLAELERIIPEQPQSPRDDTGKLDKEKALALLEKLESLLQTGSAESLELWEELGNILSPVGAEYQELAARMENLDFPGALGKLPAVRQAVTGREESC
jgi:signal transduction histidine kinase/CheY-like chemotaxis protein